MKLALQLSCYNGSRYLPSLFRSLAEQTDRTWRLFVLDNGSRPEEAEAIRRAVADSGLPAELHRVEQNVGFAGAHNLLFSKHDGEYVQLLNDDAILEPDYLRHCAAYLGAHPECAAVSGKIYRWNFDRRAEPDRGRTRIIDSLGLAKKRTGAIADIGAGKPEGAPTIVPTDVLGVSGCLPMYRAAAVRRVSMDGALFDASYVSYKEDVDLALRLCAGGYTAAVVPAAVAYHRRSVGAGVARTPSPAARYQSYRNHLWTLFAHCRSPFSSENIFVLPYEAAKALYWLCRRPDFLSRAVRDTARAWTHLMEKRRFVRRLAIERPADDAPSEADVAIIMVSHNDLNDACLASLANARRMTKLKIALVVADNGSAAYRANELVAKYFDDARVLLRGADHGFGRSCNRGAAEIPADYYFFLNPDTVLDDPAIFDKLHDYLAAHPKTGLVAPKILYFDGRLQETCRRFPAWYMPFIQRTSLKETAFGRAYTEKFSMADYDHAAERAVDWVQGSAMFVPRTVWREMGGFDDRYFMYFEDIDLCRRIRLSGRDVVYLPSTMIKHAYGKESARIPGLLNNLLRNQMARAHLASWGRYMVKWKWEKPPASL